MLSYAGESFQNASQTQHLHLREISFNYHHVLIMNSADNKAVASFHIKYLADVKGYVIDFPWGSRIYVRDILNNIFEYNRLLRYAENSTTYTRERAAAFSSIGLEYMDNELKKINYIKTNGKHFQTEFILSQTQEEVIKKEYDQVLSRIHGQFSWLLENYLFYHIEEHFIQKGSVRKITPKHWFNNHRGVDSEVVHGQKKYLHKIIKLKQEINKDKIFKWSSYNFLTMSIATIYIYDTFYSPMSLNRFIQPLISTEIAPYQDLAILGLLSTFQGYSALKLKKWLNIYGSYKDKLKPLPKLTHEKKCKTLFK